MAYKNGGGTALDAATSSGLAFLNAQLELAQPELIQPLASMTHPRDVTVTFGGGFPEFLSAYRVDYGSAGGGQLGLQGTSNTDVPEVQVDVAKGVWRTTIWAHSFTVKKLDLDRLQTAQRIGQAAPFTLPGLLEKGIKLVYNNVIERVAYLGWDGYPGLINNPAVTATLAAATGTGGLRTWASKSPVQILQDINTAILSTVQAGAYSLESIADTILVPWDLMSNYLMQPLAVAGTTGGVSVLEYVLNNNIAKQNGVDFKILPLANPWISGQGTGGTNRMLAYRNTAETVRLHIPTPCQKVWTMPTNRSGGAFESLYNACIGQLQVYRTQAMGYVDGI